MPCVCLWVSDFILEDTKERGHCSHGKTGARNRGAAGLPQVTQQTSPLLLSSSLQALPEEGACRSWTAALLQVVLPGIKLTAI